jgi:hypothetical protein
VRAQLRGEARGERASTRRSPRRSPGRSRSFATALAALDAVAAAGAQVSVCVTDLDSGETVLAGDAHLVLPVAGIGVVPLLIEVAAQIDAGTLDPLQIIERSSVAPVTVGASGIGWRLPRFRCAIWRCSRGGIRRRRRQCAAGARGAGAVRARSSRSVS